MVLKADVTYLIENAKDPGALIALDAKVENGYLQWFDTSHDRAQPALSVTDVGDDTVVETPNGTYTLKPMTVELYEQKVQPYVTGNKRFISDIELQAFYSAFPR